MTVPVVQRPLKLPVALDLRLEPPKLNNDPRSSAKVLPLDSPCPSVRDHTVAGMSRASPTIRRYVRRRAPTQLRPGPMAFELKAPCCVYAAGWAARPLDRNERWRLRSSDATVWVHTSLPVLSQSNCARELDNRPHSNVYCFDAQRLATDHVRPTHLLPTWTRIRTIRGRIAFCPP